MCQLWIIMYFKELPCLQVEIWSNTSQIQIRPHSMEGQSGNTLMRFFSCHLHSTCHPSSQDVSESPQYLLPLPLTILPLLPHSPSRFFFSNKNSDTLISTTSQVLTPSPHFTCCTRKSKHSTPSSTTISPIFIFSSACHISVSSSPPHMETFVS